MVGVRNFWAGTRAEVRLLESYRSGRKKRSLNEVEKKADGDRGRKVEFVEEEGA